MNRHESQSIITNFRATAELAVFFECTPPSEIMGSEDMREIYEEEPETRFYMVREENLPLGLRRAVLSVLMAAFPSMRRRGYRATVFFCRRPSSGAIAPICALAWVKRVSDISKSKDYAFGDAST